jgi:hypothetical protein
LGGWARKIRVVRQLAPPGASARAWQAASQFATNRDPQPNLYTWNSRITAIFARKPGWHAV